MKQIQSQDKFRFFVPVEIQKGKDGKIKEVIVQGKASSPDLDSQEEMLDPQGADLSSFVLINDNHIKGASGILGEIVESQAKKDGIYLKGKLYPELDNVKKLVQLEEAIAKNKGKLRLAMSIEGRALERDPIDKRKITRSRLSGVALTYQPIQSNTWASLITKGASYQQDDELEYQVADGIEKSNGGNEQYILDIIDENGNRITVNKEDLSINITKIDKAMTTSNASAVIPESLESDLKQNQKKLTKSFFIQNKSDKFNTKLSKSEVFDYIFDSIPDISLNSTKQLYTIIGVLQKSNNELMSELTQEKIEKAFNIIGTLSDQADSIQKGFDKTQGDQESNLKKMTTLIKGYMEQKMSKSDIFKAMKEKEGYKDDDDEDMEKAYGMCEGDMKKSQDTSSDLNKEEESLDDQITKAEQSLAQLKTKKQQEINKSEVVEQDTSKIEQLIKGMQDSFDQKFAAIGEINKQILEDNEELKNKLIKSEDERSELEQKSQGRKGIATQSYIEKGTQDDLNKQNTLSVTQNKQDILQKADTMIDYQSESIQKGQGDEFRFAQLVAGYESTSQIPQSDIKFFADKFAKQGIKLVA